MVQCSQAVSWLTGFDVLPLSTPTAVTVNTQGCHSDTPSLWSRCRLDAAEISKCMTCDPSSVCVSLCHIPHLLLSVSSSQAPVMGRYWFITWPVVFSTKNSVSTLVKSGKIITPLCWQWTWPRVFFFLLVIYPSVRLLAFVILVNTISQEHVGQISLN